MYMYICPYVHIYIYVYVHIYIYIETKNEKITSMHFVEFLYLQHSLKITVFADISKIYYHHFRSSCQSQFKYKSPMSSCKLAFGKSYLLLMKLVTFIYFLS